MKNTHTNHLFMNATQIFCGDKHVRHFILTLIFMILWSTTSLAGQTSQKGPDEKDILEGLMAGRDQKEAVALLLDAPIQHTPKSRDQMLRHFGADYQKLLGWAQPTAAGKTGVAFPQAVLDRLFANRLLLDARLKGASNTLEGAPSRIAARHAAAMEQFGEMFRIIDALMSTDDADHKRDLAEQLLAFEPPAKAQPPVLRAANLPFAQAATGAPPLVTSPVILPSYLDANAAPAVGADLTHTQDTPLSKVILDHAASLEYDYVNIFQFVLREIDTQYYAGAMKGAEATLRTRAGNAVDQASLLIALFRASGLPARFVHGVIRLPIATAGEPLGLTDPDAIIRALNQAGIPHEPVIRGGKVAEVKMAHTWVSAYAPYAHYRGTTVDTSGKAWIPLDASVKPHLLRPAGTVLSHMDFSGDTFVDSHIQGQGMDHPLNRLRDDIELHLRENPELGNYAEQGAGIRNDAAEVGLLPASLPFPVEVVLEEADKLDASRRHSLRVVAETMSGDAIMDIQLPMSQLIDHRITLSYEPATVDDHNTMERFASRAMTPAYLLRLRPQLNIDGIPAGAGTGDLANAEPHRLVLTLEGPGISRQTEQVLTTGSYAAIGLSAQLGEPPILDTDLPDDREQKAARLLYNHVARYQGEWDAAEAELAGLLDIAAVRPLPALAMVISNFDVEYAGALPMSLNFTGVNLDAPLRTAVPISRTGNEDTERQWMRLAALQGSHLEASVFQDQWGVTSVSADVGLRAAFNAGQTLFEVDTETLADTLSQLSHPTHVTDELTALVGQGYNVTIPAGPVTVAQWTGSVWTALDPDTGNTGYFISGGLAGGATAEEVEAWALEELAEILGNPYDGEPNTDPLAAARIRRLPGADGQVGVAGEPLDTPLTVLVTDKYGRPVEGSQVFFRINLGGGELEGGANEASVYTNNLGIAEMSMTLNQSTGDVPVYAYLNPGDEYPSQLGEAWITAAAVGFNGPVALDLPFTVYAKPDEPATLRRLGDNGFNGSASNWVGPLRVMVEDQHGNPIANQEVSYAGGTPINHLDPEDCPANPSPVLFFEGGDCDVPAVPGTLGCGSPSLNRTSTVFGTSAHVITGDTGGVEYPIVVSTSGTDNVEVSAFAWGSCGRWSYIYLQSQSYIGHNGNVRDAAEPGGTTALPRRANLGYAYYVMDGDTPVYNKHEFFPTEGSLTFEVAGGGNTGLSSIGGGRYEGSLNVGGAPAKYDVTLRAEGFYYEFRRWSSHEIEGGTYDGAYTSDVAEVYAVTPTAMEVIPSPVILDLDGRSKVGLTVSYEVLPAEYDAPILVNLFDEGQLMQYRLRPNGPNTGTVTFPPGLIFDLDRNYEVEVVVNPNDAFEIKSERIPVRVTKQIFSHVANAEIPSLSANIPVGGGPVANDSVGPPLLFYSDYDVPNVILCEVAAMSFGTTQDATVSMIFERLDEEGEPDGFTQELMVDQSLAEGEHPVFLPLRTGMGAGDWRYTLTGTSQVDGHVDTVTGRATTTVISRNALPVGHPIVKGVDLYDGSYSHSRQDLEIPGIGGGLEFNHSYSSKGRDNPGVMGFGWAHNFMASITQSRCGDFLVSGAEGGSMRFGVDDDTGALYPLKGYHGTLIREADDQFVYYSPGGTRYNYSKKQPRVWWLDEIVDGNGNSTTLTYVETSFAPQLTTVTDAAGRTLNFSYANRQFGRWNGDVLIGVTGPGGISIEFDYDDLGNLTSASRGSYFSETYTYATSAGFVGRHLLSGYTDNIGGVGREYTFQEQTFTVTFNDEPFEYLVPIVASISDIDGTSTGFSYTPGTMGFSAATTTDGRGQSTSYSMNDYGAAISIGTPAGNFSVSWDMDQVVKTGSTDPNGVTTTYSVDQEGNITSESGGGRSRSYTYIGSGAFRNFNKNVPGSYTDGNGRTTTYTYDSAGNMTSESKGGRTTTYAYDGSGNLRAKVDPGGNTYRYTSDGNGYITREQLPTGHTRSATYDVLGRQLSNTDAEGNTTTYSYDGRDRVVSEQRPNAGTISTSYNDGSFTETRTDGNGNTTVTVHDPMGRVLSIRDGEGQTTSFSYDGNGNKISETDTAGRTTTYSYDGGDRMTSRNAPGGRSTSYSYDNVGNLLSETTGSRTTTYTYDDMRNRLTTNRNGLVTSCSWDSEGNKLSETDPMGRTTSWTYDAQDNKLTENGPMGSGKLWEYDGAGFLVKETILNNSNQVFFYVNDAMGRRIQTTDPEGNVSAYAVDGNGRVLRSVDGRGKDNEHSYDGAGNRTSATDGEGNTTSFTYDNNGNVLTETQANGNVVTYTYDKLDRELSKSDSEGLIYAYTYDAAGNLLTETDERGNTITHGYDANNNRTSSQLPEGRSLGFGYNVHGDRTSETDAGGNTITHSYDDWGRLTSSNGPDGYSFSFTYDDADNRTSETDSLGNTITYVFNDLNQLISQTDGVGTESHTYDKLSNRLSTTDRRGITTTWTYDSMNRMLTHNRAGITLERRTYDEVGNLAISLDANGNAVSYEYDGNNRVIVENRPALAVTHFNRDEAGNITEEVRPGGYTITRTFDRRSRQTSETNGEGETTGYTLDGAGNMTEVAKPQGTWRMTWDNANRLTSVQDPEGNTTSYTYDLNDNLLSQTLGANTVSFTYDAWKRPLSKNYADGAVINFSYDANGNLLTRSEPGGRSTTYTYDALNRMTQAAHTGTGGAVTISFTLDGNGNQTSVTRADSTGSHTETRIFDNLDRPTLVEDGFGRDIQYTYDANSNRASMLDPEGNLTSYFYDQLNRLSQVTVAGLGTWSYSFYPNSLLRDIDHPNGASSSYTYDNANRVVNLTNEQNGEMVSSHSYNYDNGGRRTQLIEENGAGLETTTYTYDAADRLTGVNYPANTVSYVLDAAGNRTSETRDGVTRDYTYNNRYQLTSVFGPDVDVTYTYDATGNMITRTENAETTTFSYDARNRLVGLDGPSVPTTSYEYDANGMRIARNVGGDRFEYIYDGTEMIAETNTLGTTIASYHYGAGRRLAEKRGADRSYYLQDVLGSPVALTAADGSIQARYTYDAWGNVTRTEGTSQQPFGFTGYEKDEESGLYYAKNRYYDSTTGRFLREDPYEGDTNQPITLHPYVYGSANPTLVVDPTGLYGEGGHYYTTYFVARTVGYSAEEAATLALYSQLPDEVGRWDAIAQKVQKELRVLSFSLIMSGSYGYNPLMEQQMEDIDAAQDNVVAVQQGLHALTGTRGADETEITAEVLLNAEDLETAGVAIHRLGDTFAHRDVDDTGLLYETGFGHFRDFHEPDEIHRRPELFKSYVTKLAETLAARKGNPVTEEQSQRLTQLYEAVEKAREDSTWTEISYWTGRPVRTHIRHGAADKRTVELFRDLVLKEFGDSSLLNPETHSISHTDHAGEEVQNIEGLLKAAESHGLDVDKAIGNRPKSGIEQQLRTSAEKVIQEIQRLRAERGLTGKKDKGPKEEARDAARQEDTGMLIEEPKHLDQMLGPIYP